MTRRATRLSNFDDGERPSFFMGQDSTTLSEYKSAVLDTDATAPRPGGVTLYTNIVLPDALAGVHTGIDYGSGLVASARR